MVKFLLCRTAKYGNLLKLKLLALAVPLFLLPNILVAQIQSSFVFEGYTRTYLVYLPPSYNDVDSMPVVFNLHGYQLNAEQQMDYSRMNKVADTAGFIVVYPNAVNTAWNCGVSGPPNVNDVGFISVLIDTLADHYSIDKEKIYSCGFSLGGFMSHRLACELSNRIAAIADVGGVMAISLLNNTSTLHSMPVLKIHGTDDLIVPYNGQLDWSSVQQTLNHWTNFNLCNPPDTISMPNLDTLDGCTVQKIRYHFLSDSGDVIFYKVLSGGHSWPGGDTAYFTWHSLGPIGKTNIDINASELIWNFFKNYRLSEPTEVKEHIQAPSEFDLFQNYPNPFNPVTTIGYVLKDKSNAKVTLLNAIGEEVAVLVNGEQDKGFQKIDFNASTLASGVYFYRLQAGDYLQTRKMILLK